MYSRKKICKSQSLLQSPNLIFINSYLKDGLPDWIWSVDGYEFEWNEMPSCWDPTYCNDPFPPINGTNVEIIEPPDEGSLKYKDGEHILYRCKSPGKC